MKKIIKPAVHTYEEAEFYSDFNLDKKAFIRLELWGGYGSNMDLEKYSFDLDEEFCTELLAFLKSKLDTRGKTDLNDFKKEMQIGLD